MNTDFTGLCIYYQYQAISSVWSTFKCDKILF